MQNSSSKLTLSSLTNEFLKAASYIQLAIFLSISFKYYFFTLYWIYFYFFSKIRISLSIFSIIIRLVQ